MTAVFISYAHEDRPLAEDIYHALGKAGYTAHLDAKSLPKGEEYNLEIRRLILSSDYFVFLISPDSVASGSYARTELGYAEIKWSTKPNGVLPVMARNTDIGSIPSFLRQLNILKPEGNPTAEVVAELNRQISASVQQADEALESREPRAKRYFEESLDSRHRYYEMMSHRNRLQYLSSQAVFVLVAFSLPTISLMSTILLTYVGVVLQIAISGLLVVTVVINLLRNPQVRAIRYASAAERMKREYRMYCNVAAPYTAGLGEARAYQLFVETVEQILLEAERD